ncbi:hypothetical protein ACU4GD_39115 [Cupriavidus basilensis]
MNSLSFHPLCSSTTSISAEHGGDLDWHTSWPFGAAAHVDDRSERADELTRAERTASLSLIRATWAAEKKKHWQGCTAGLLA